MQMDLETVLITLVMLLQESCHQPEAWKHNPVTLTRSAPTVRDCKQISNLYNTDLAVKTKSLIFNI